MSKIIDRTGLRFGRLVVIEPSALQYGTSGIRWKCLCDCGKYTDVSGGKLQSGHTRSCGCLMVETCIKRSTKHGLSRSKEYEAWMGMKRRCYREDSRNFTYKEKGIKVCDEWLNSFEAFYSYIGPSPENSSKWSVGRINNDGNYEPGNVRWELLDTQARNHSRQKNNTSGITGVYFKTDEKGKCYWIAFWNDHNCTKRRKMFSVSKYGYDEAKQLAADYRKLKINELKEFGIDYAESHGSKMGE